MNRSFLLFFILIAFSLHAVAGIYDPVNDLADRRVPWLSSHLKLKKMAAPKDGQDIFKLYTKKGKVVIKASNVNAAATGLNWYLEKYCHRSMSHLGDYLSPVKQLPKIKEEITVKSPFQYRYALNYCTLNYTMSFYDWEDWQWELDWMALHGVNLMLTPIGTEAVWQKTLEYFDFSDQEIKDFLPGPAFNAWWLMGNLEGWDGPITQNMIDRRTHLQQNILERMNDLGIEPVLQGFYGMVPRALSKHFPQAAIRDQGKWAGGFDQPAFLLPEDPLFVQMAKVYYDNIRKLYGKNIHYFGGDPFHEGGSAAGVDLTKAGQKIQSYMQQSFPGSTWLLQGWQSNPKRELLEGLDKKQVLVLELAGEKANDWERRNGFEQTSFIWCTANNFGGESGLYGKLQFFTDEVQRILSGPYSGLCKGIGIMPEGIHNNPVVYDLMLELGWNPRKVNPDSWIAQYISYRYDLEDDSLQKAWDIFTNTVYSSPENDAGMPEDLFCARPGWNLQNVSTWGSIRRDYNQMDFAKGVKTYLSIFPNYQNYKNYFIDAVDFTRQALANKGNILYQKIQNSFQEKDSSLFKKQSEHFIHLMMVDDSLLSLSKHFRLKRWLKAAQSLGTTPEEKELFVRNAREQITFWGPDTNPHTDLHDYAAKEWSGLIRSFYVPRWKMFFKQQLNILRGKEPRSISYFDFEKAWALQKPLPEPIEIKNPSKFIQRVKKQF